ncbi:hypothetical protein [Tenacibaculum finnmarkense]|uniref:Restriction endonuclease type IV Mrr domain-containing protein n=1 Tax=Tenacibaculum finnmarkense genomovar finnmarkense TaxID=1458503 RepID=A0AAP1RGW7_9FLAO|nr:hypothetical protein [Tenacibaculum finnmarkense]MBE7653456.1 hypothetical protein [Tenacibaculum finnmarkense genomovar finnmarkense]MBE7695756.1 hypothetical protein [Tenacibaculum finnmarkense genomovar finnmarkense]SOS50603.1 conserved hypothetical protein [Tenacibaculum finnmarkense]
MSQVNDFIQRLDACPLGSPGWVQFENLCTEVLTYLFVPPLIRPQRQANTYSGVNRRDAIFPNRNIVPNTDQHSKNWFHLFQELNARMILFEFKNYEATEIGTNEVNQTLNYLTNPMGRFAILVCTKTPNNSAHIRRNTIYSNDQKVILFMTKEHLKEMLVMKERDEDPSDLVIDLLEMFYIQHE